MTATTATATQFKLDSGTPDELTAHGVLDFATAATALHSINAAVTGAAPHTLDLAGVTHGDSAGLACLLAVMAGAASRGCPLRLLNLPADLRTLAGVCGVEQLLSDSAAG